MQARTIIAAAVAAVLLAAGAVQADVFNMDPNIYGPNVKSLETVPVGDPGYGGVAYTYNIGKYEVTAGQYTEFLNAVAATDTYGLYDPNMASGGMWVCGGCQIAQSGNSGNYTYSVASDWANRPVNFVSWGDAARFANWLHNGHPTGAQNLSTTEDGAYYLNGATTDEQLLAATRKANWKWAITNEDEWHKGGYYDPNKPGGAGFWAFPTGTDAIPGTGGRPDADPENEANFMDQWNGQIGPWWTVFGPQTTPVGYFSASDSPYGTFDQGGNVQEWCEPGSLLGGEYMLPSDCLQFSWEAGYYQARTYSDTFSGFRVSEVPEPGSAVLLIAGAVAVFRRRAMR